MKPRGGPQDCERWDFYEAHNWTKHLTTHFDVELAQAAEENSLKWSRLFHNASHCSDAKIVSRIIRTTGINIHGINSFNDRNFLGDAKSKPDSVDEKNKMILLSGKYFEFETGEDQASTSTSRMESEINSSRSVFACSDSSNDEGDAKYNETLKIEVNKNHTENALKTQKNKKKLKKKSRAQYRSWTSDDAVAINPEIRAGAPPGVQVVKSRNPRNLDLSKSEKYSLQFRL